MKTKEELLSMTYAKLAELQNMKHKHIDAHTLMLAQRLQTELTLLYDILGDDIPEEYWEQIEKEINV